MKSHDGLGLFDVIISIGIFALLIVAISSLLIAVFKNNTIATSRTSIDQHSLTVLHNFTSEIRAAQTSYDGSFPLALTTADTVSFYADINGNGTIEKVRYWIENNTLKRGVIVPNGQPLTYDPANESVSSLVENVTAEPPYFIYYGTSYDGSATALPLVQPVSPSDVRLVELRLNVSTGAANQGTRMLETSAMIRSLKNR